MSKYSCDLPEDFFKELSDSWRYILDIPEDGLMIKDIDRYELRSLKKLSDLYILEKKTRPPRFELTEAGISMREAFELLTATGTSAGPTEPVNVVIIEDDDIMAQMFERWLGDTFEVKIVGSSDYIDAVTPETDVIVVERFLKEKKCSDMIEEIRQRWSDMPVLAIVGVKPEIEDVELGADEYLVKPINREELIESIFRLAGNKNG